MFQWLKHCMLTWLGILGGALTLLSNLQGVLDLAKWADYLVSKWATVAASAVQSLTETFDIRVSAEANSMIAMALFVSFIAVGARVENEFKVEKREVHPVVWSNIFNRRVLLALVLYTADVVILSLPAFLYVAASTYLAYPSAYIGVCLFLYCAAIVVGLRGWPVWTAVVVAISMLGLSFIFAYSSGSLMEPNVSETASTTIAAVCAILCGLIVVGLAPPLAFTRRIIFMMVGVAAVVLLSQVNHLGIAATPLT